jgi:hypothetical protein
MRTKGRGLAASALLLPLFTQVRGIEILRTSPLRSSAKFAFWAFSEVPIAPVLYSRLSYVEHRRFMARRT